MTSKLKAYNYIKFSAKASAESCTLKALFKCCFIFHLILLKGSQSEAKNRIKILGTPMPKKDRERKKNINAN